MATGNGNVEMMVSVLPGTFTGFAALNAGLASINNSFLNMTQAISDNFGLVDTAILTSGALITQVAANAMNSFADFEQSMKIVQMVSQATANDISYLGQKANEFAVQYRVDIDNITEGLQTLGRAGLNTASEQTEVLQNGLNTAKLEGRELNSVLQELIQNTALLGGDLKSDQFGEDSEYVNNLMVSTSLSAPINTHDISETLKYSGGIAAAAGANIESEQGKEILTDYMAAIAAFARKGVTGSIAGTALRAFFNKPATQDSSVVEALASINLKPEFLWEDDEETMKPISEQIAIIQGQMDKLNVSTMDRLQLWSKIVGGKMGQQMMKLDSDDIKDISADIKEAESASSLANKSMQTFKSNINEIGQAGQAAFRNFGSTLVWVFNPVVEILKQVTELLNNPLVTTGLAFGLLGFFRMFVSRARQVLSGFKTGLANIWRDYARGEKHSIKFYRQEVDEHGNPILVSSRGKSGISSTGFSTPRTEAQFVSQWKNTPWSRYLRGEITADQLGALKAFEKFKDKDTKDKKGNVKKASRRISFANKDGKSFMTEVFKGATDKEIMSTLIEKNLLKPEHYKALQNMSGLDFLRKYDLEMGKLYLDYLDHTGQLYDLRHAVQQDNQAEEERKKTVQTQTNTKKESNAVQKRSNEESLTQQQAYWNRQNKLETLKQQEKGQIIANANRSVVADTTTTTKVISTEWHAMCAKLGMDMRGLSLLTHPMMMHSPTAFLEDDQVSPTGPYPWGMPAVVTDINKAKADARKKRYNPSENTNDLVHPYPPSMTDEEMKEFEKYKKEVKKQEILARNRKNAYGSADAPIPVSNQSSVLPKVTPGQATSEARAMEIEELRMAQEQLEIEFRVMEYARERDLIEKQILATEQEKLAIEREKAIASQKAWNAVEEGKKRVAKVDERTARANQEATQKMIDKGIIKSPEQKKIDAEARRYATEKKAVEEQFLKTQNAKKSAEFVATRHNYIPTSSNALNQIGRELGRGVGEYNGGYTSGIGLKQKILDNPELAATPGSKAGYYSLSSSQIQQLQAYSPPSSSVFKNQLLGYLGGGREGRMIGFANKGIGKFANGILNATDAVGGPFMVAIMIATFAIQRFQQWQEDYNQALQKATDRLNEAYKTIESAESNLRQTFTENNPDLSGDEIDAMVYDTYSQMNDDLANAWNNGMQEWIKKAAPQSAKLPEYEEDENGDLKEKEDTEKSYEEAVQENTQALYAAMTELQIATSKFVTQATDKWWGTDGVFTQISDALGLVSDKFYGGGSSFEEGNEFLLNASQKDENYSGYTEMAGLMLEDFKDAEGNWIKGMRTMMGKSVEDLAAIVPDSTNTFLKHEAQFASSMGPANNARLQSSMQRDKKTWQSLAKEIAKEERKTGKPLGTKETGNKKLEGLVSKLSASMGNNFNRTQILQAAYLQQMQDMYAIAQQVMTPLIEQNTRYAADIMRTNMGINTGTGAVGGNTGSTVEVASSIAAMVAIIAKSSAKTAARDVALDIDPNTASADDKHLYDLAIKSQDGDDFYRMLVEDSHKTTQTSYDKLYGINKFLEIYGASSKMTGWGYDAESATKSAQEAIKEARARGASTQDILHTFEKNYTESSKFKEALMAAYEASDIGESDDGGSSGSGSGSDNDNKDTGTKKERVDLVLCNKKEIPKLNVNLFKKAPSFTVLNKNFKLRDIKVNTQDKPKAILSSIKNAIIDVQKRSDPKIIQDEAAEYDPVSATDGTQVPSGSTSTATD